MYFNIMDDLDRQIIVELQKDGRLGYADLANTLHISESTARNRVKNILKQKLITVNAIPNLKTMGYNFIGIMGLQVNLTKRKEIAEKLAGRCEVCHVMSVTGEHDLMAIIAAKSATDFADFSDKFVASLPGVFRTVTYVWLNVYKGNEYNLDTKQLINEMGI